MAKTQARPKPSRREIALRTIVGFLALFIVIQFVPYGRDHLNQPATKPFKWRSPMAEAITKASCYDCHSNETQWWWAVKIAPFSWLAQHDIAGAQRRVNFSAWNGALTAEGMQRAINRDMPPLQFTLFHPGTKLTDAQKQTLVLGFRDSLTANQGLAESLTEPAATSSGSNAIAIINARCNACHSPDAALRFRAPSADLAKGLIDRMVKQGAKVSAVEEQVLIDHFTR